jgi:hypothetical protein
MIETTVTSKPLMLREHCDDAVDTCSDRSLHNMAQESIRLSSTSSAGRNSFGSNRSFRRSSSMGLRRSSNSLYLHSLSSLSEQSDELQNDGLFSLNNNTIVFEKSERKQSERAHDELCDQEDSAQIGKLIPNWLQNGIIFMGLYHQSFAIIIMMYLVQSVAVTDIKGWIRLLPMGLSTSEAMKARGSTLENIRQYYQNHSNGSLNGCEASAATSTTSSNGMRKSVSDEWGHFTDFDETFTDITSPIVSNAALTAKRNKVNVHVNLNLGTVQESDDEEE